MWTMHVVSDSDAHMGMLEISATKTIDKRTTEDPCTLCLQLDGAVKQTI